jgi:phosphate transporter
VRYVQHGLSGDSGITIASAQLKDRYLYQVVEQASPFQRTSKDRVNDGIKRLQTLYAKCVTHEDKALALQQLKLHQRENIAWERDTVWRQMIGRERRGEGDGDIKAIGATLVTEEESSLFHIATPVGRLRLTRKKLFVVLAITVFIVLLNVPMLDEVEASRCFAILVFSTILWATEVHHFHFSPRLC